MSTTTHTKKGELMLLQDGEPVFTARVSRTVKGAIDVLRMSGIVEHPSPRQALALARKAGISKADFDTAFGHLGSGK
jgi:hypothetical protein